MSNPDGWKRLWRDVGAHGDSGSVLRLLERLYSEPHRHYHTMAHVEHCLWEFDVAREQAQHPVEVEMALWFHDAVFDTRAQDNEQRSAELAAQILQDAGTAPERVERIKRLILATSHDRTIQDPDAGLVEDVDLAVLGQSESEFDRYEEMIRSEYSWVADTAFRAGRANLLQSFLTRESIYSTPFFRERYEEDARANIQRSLEWLVTSSTETALPWLKSAGGEGAPPSP
jgi:predicted metal-dependent HD superfamily phosphohydrolase